MNPLIILIFIALSSKLKCKVTSEEIEARIEYKPDGTWKITKGDFNDTINYVATAYYGPSLERTGWDTLAITTNKIFNDELQAEAAGRLEGHLTKERIASHFINLVKGRDSEPLSEDVQSFLLQQEEFIVSQYKKNSSDPHIYFAYLSYLQLKGIRDQYNEEAETKINVTDFHIMASNTELTEIEEKFDPPDYSKMTPKQFRKYVLTHERCSALFKAKSDLTDVYFGHNTWDIFSLMTRIIKEMNLNYNHPSTKATTVIFTSYPGTIGSADDLYLTSADLSVIETTSLFFNNSLYEFVIPQSYPTWIRSMTANIMSTTSEEWGKHFKQFNSGTYCNQWMILDMKKIDLDKKIIDEKSFYVTEQIPGYITTNDVTDQLRFGYWPSYNTPYDKVIKGLSMIQERIEEIPESATIIDYDTCARANIFRRDQSKVEDIESLKALLRYNNYLEDPLALGSATGSISGRADLTGEYCGGAYDAKAGSVKEFKENKRLYLIAGPTDQGVPEFNWEESEICKDLGREGLPTKPKFEWIEYKSRFLS